MWRDNLNGNAAALNGNGTGGATVTAADYNLWRTNFGNSYSGSIVGSGSAAVPEPSAMIVTGLAILLSVAVFNRFELSICVVSVTFASQYPTFSIDALAEMLHGLSGYHYWRLAKD